MYLLWFFTAEEYNFITKNCAQGTALALMEEFGLGNMEIIKALTPFPGVGGTGEICGGITGSLITFGLFFGSDNPLDFQTAVNTIIPGQTPCLACLSPEGVGGLGVLGVAPALIANLQSLEAIKLLIGHSPSLAGKLLLFNGDDMKFQLLEIRRNESCPVCSPLYAG